MPRGPRQESPTGIYHVTSRGNGGLHIFGDDADRTGFLAFLCAVADREDWRLYAYCLLGTHVHLVLRSELSSLSRGMQRLKTRYGRYFNARYDRFGHVFESRFPSTPILTERHAVAACAYVAVNPVAAGVCHAASDWPWSSHRAIVGLEAQPTFLAPLNELGTTVVAYGEIVAAKERELASRRQGGDGHCGIRPHAPGTDTRRVSVPALPP